MKKRYYESEYESDYEDYYIRNRARKEDACVWCIISLIIGVLIAFVFQIVSCL